MLAVSTQTQSCAMDVSSLYTNIPQQERTTACLEAIQKINNPTEILETLIDILLRDNIFGFSSNIITSFIHS